MFRYILEWLWRVLIMLTKTDLLIKEAVKDTGIMLEDEHYEVAVAIILKCASIADKSGRIHNKSEVAKMEADRIRDKILAAFGMEL
jgi:hypothetical protein